MFKTQIYADIYAEDGAITSVHRMVELPFPPAAGLRLTFSPRGEIREALGPHWSPGFSSVLLDGASYNVDSQTFTCRGLLSFHPLERFTDEWFELMILYGWWTDRNDPMDDLMQEFKKLEP